ncbi:unnamed protein product [Prunus armeniaca]
MLPEGRPQQVIGMVLKMKNSPEQAKTLQCSHLEFESRETTSHGPLATGRFEADSDLWGATRHFQPATSCFQVESRAIGHLLPATDRFQAEAPATGRLQYATVRFQSGTILKEKVLKFERCWHRDAPPVRLKNIYRVPGTQHP